ncbi:PqqD family peptide modification chaperone [Mucilaginibacter sp. E4BP6]|uniref:PqqD family peptide modification chaperone n=1 Tax=Mucilaginibacter sp. E4BP6 TaxID=2723089 RepID=UPI0015CDD83B|nr:PqqD family peptide modification chaperone [Mucilaginibacter sp. E4BP6]NYE68245.1 hypothetical protein [Mucilaginibacter sp. E4BP6]
MLNDESLTLETVLQKNTQNLLISEVGDELVMMDMEKGNYINLNKIGRIIWEQIENQITVIELINLLTNRFDVQKDECTKDTLEYLQKMYDQNLLSVK